FIVPMSVACVALITWGNLRGVRESGRIFAVPTYVYVIALGGVVLFGLFRHLTGHLPPIPSDQTGPLPPQTATIGLLLLMHAYASGCTALTGGEAISNGGPAFRRPGAGNARRTLVAMGTILGCLFLGTSFLAVTTHMLPYPSGNPTLVGQLANYILDAHASRLGHAAFEFVQGATLVILILAANTSFADFPRLASFAAGDPFMPRQFPPGARLHPPPVHPPRPQAGVLQRHPHPGGGGDRAAGGVQGQHQQPDPAVRDRGVHLLHPVPGGHDPPAPAAAGARLALRGRGQWAGGAGGIGWVVGYCTD